jgi:ankyrin repeat protein
LPEVKALGIFRTHSSPLRNNLLHAACYMVCMCNHVSLVTELLRAQPPTVLLAMINEQNANGETPLDMAIKENLLQTTAMMKQLLGTKASLLAQSSGLSNAS